MLSEEERDTRRGDGSDGRDERRHRLSDSLVEIWRTGLKIYSDLYPLINFIYKILSYNRLQNDRYFKMMNRLDKNKLFRKSIN